ncbi:MAG: hypothetical protein HQM08_22690 [Candidatus Riflebacteria bacterium]|nr:hypothetical protein [Candidatus Riflebacteria bacterium]
MHTLIFGFLELYLTIFFPMVWLTCFLGILLYGFLLKTKRVEEKSLKKIGKVGLFFLGIFFSIVLICAILSKMIIQSDFQQNLNEPITRIDFFVNQKITPISDSQRISAFLSCILQAQGVISHHSHPVNLISFAIAGNGTRYILGEDSQNPHEFWLKMVNLKLYGQGECELKQFTSASLSEWLKPLK